MKEGHEKEWGCEGKVCCGCEGRRSFEGAAMMQKEKRRVAAMAVAQGMTRGAVVVEQSEGQAGDGEEGG